MNWYSRPSTEPPLSKRLRNKTISPIDSPVDLVGSSWYILAPNGCAYVSKEFQGGCDKGEQ